MKQILITIAAVVLVGCGPSISIHKAAEEGNIEVVKQHLAAGTDVNEGDEDGDTPLIYALEEGHKEVAKLLITKGADVNAKRDFAKTSPLHFAAAQDLKEIAALLIAKGANVNARGEFQGWTPLMAAARRGKVDIAELLIANGADVNAKNRIGSTPLGWAENYPQKYPGIRAIFDKHGIKYGGKLKAFKAAGN